MGSWKFSTLKSIRAIAFMDLIDAVIFAVYRGISLSILLAKIPTKSDREMTGTSVRTPGTGLVSSSSRGGGLNHSLAHQQLHSNGGSRGNLGDDDAQSFGAGATYMRYWSVVLLTGIVITFAVEVFLFLLLNSGAPMRNLRHCKHWFCLRVILLLFSIAGSIIDLSLGEYSLIMGLLEVEKIYRVVTLVVMWKFMDEIKAGDFDNSKLNFGTDIGSSFAAIERSFSQAP